MVGLLIIGIIIYFGVSAFGFRPWFPHFRFSVSAKNFHFGASLVFTFRLIRSVCYCVKPSLPVRHNKESSEWEFSLALVRHNNKQRRMYIDGALMPYSITSLPNLWLTAEALSLNTRPIAKSVIRISPWDPKWGENRVQVDKSQSYPLNHWHVELYIL